jgi:1,2-phenylacetyl-CoA epoxidase PaaB subunit
VRDEFCRGELCEQLEEQLLERHKRIIQFQLQLNKSDTESMNKRETVLQERKEKVSNWLAKYDNQSTGCPERLESQRGAEVNMRTSTKYVYSYLSRRRMGLVYSLMAEINRC